MTRKSRKVTNEIKSVMESGFSSMDDMWPKNQHSFDVQTHGRPSRIFQIMGRGVKQATTAGDEHFPYFHWREGLFDCILETGTWNGGTPFEEYILRIKGGSNLFVELGSSFRSEWEYWWPAKFQTYEDMMAQFNIVIKSIEDSKGLAYSGFPRDWFLKNGKVDKIVRGLQ